MYNKFYELFTPDKITIKTPGRDVDDEGNLASWYEEEVNPSITGDLFIQLVAYYNNMMQENHYEFLPRLIFVGRDEYSLVSELYTALVQCYHWLKNRLSKDEAEDFRQNVQDIINDYYREEYEEELC